MPFYLIKNNLKLMLRSKWILFMMIILPVVTIALLSNAFKEMMNTSFTIDDFKVGYRISDDSSYKGMISELKKICKKQGITLQDYPEGDIAKLLQSEAVAVFVEIPKDSNYVVYKSNEKDKEASVMESILNSFFYQVNEAKIEIVYAKEHGGSYLADQNSPKVNSEVLHTDPVPNSTDYYGIIYIVYFAWCGLVSLVAVISSERKSAIPRRMQVSHITKWNYYLGKFIPCTLAVFIEISAAWALSVLLLDIHWGRIGLSFGILFLLAMAASAFGMLLFQLFHNVAISIVTAFIITWVAGYFGGSFEAYMYLNIPKRLIYASPLYYVNRTLVEFSTQGSSDYLGRCLLFLVGIIIVCGIFGMLLINRNMEEQ